MLSLMLRSQQMNVKCLGAAALNSTKEKEWYCSIVWIIRFLTSPAKQTWLRRKFPATIYRQALGKIAKFGDKKTKHSIEEWGMSWGCSPWSSLGKVRSEKARARGIGAYGSVLACLDQQDQLSLPRPTKSETVGTATFHKLSRGLWCRLVFESHTICQLKT